MRAPLLALTEELRRLKAAGVRTVTVSPDALASLRQVVQRLKEERGAEPGVASGNPPVAAGEAPPAPPARRAVESPRASPASVEPTTASTLPAPSVPKVPPGDKATRWAWLRDYVLQHDVCCGNIRRGKNVVFGVGSLEAKVFFCGEAPGAEEEVQGEPFVGPAGQLLTKMIQAMGLQRDEVYIGNIMNWRPQMPTPEGAEQVGNRPPTAEEMAFCLPFLKAQIEIVDPQVIVALGATAAKGLLGPDSFNAVGEIRGKWQTFADKPLIVTYHPSYILRNQSNRSKRMIWEDLLKVMEKVGLPISARQRGYFLDK